MKEIMQVNWIYDLIFVLIFVLIVRRGWRQGMMATLLRLLGWVAAAFVIVGWANSWADQIYTTVLRGHVVNAVSAAIPADAVSAMNSTADAVESLQQVLDNLSGILGGRIIDDSAATAILETLRQDGMTMAQAITDAVLAPVLLSVLELVISLAVLLVCLSFFRFLAGASARGSRRGGGVLSKVNKLLGAALGAAESLAVAYVYAFLLSALAGALTVEWLTPAIVNSTKLVSLML